MGIYGVGLLAQKRKNSCIFKEDFFNEEKVCRTNSFTIRLRRRRRNDGVV